MAGYVSRTGARKKRGILAKCEDGLIQAIKKGKSQGAIERCSEKVRDAQLGIIKALLYETDPAASSEEQNEAFRANLEEQVTNWTDLSLKLLFNSINQKNNKSNKTLHPTRYRPLARNHGELRM